MLKMNKIKSSVITVFIVCIVSSLIFVGCASESPSSESATIQTPNGTDVSCTKILQEMPQSTYDDIENYVEQYYPNAVKVRNPTAFYNCHSYAWHSQSSSNDIWLNSPEQEKYWTDGSYDFMKKVTDWSIPSGYASYKVSYVDGDHSAIVYSSTLFISKWGNGGLYKHEPADSPYPDTTALKYYN